MIEQKGQQLFEPFWQLERASGGSRLGLAIVKGIVDLHKGRIQVISERGAGTTIRLSFPRGNGVQEASPIAVGALE